MPQGQTTKPKSLWQKLFEIQKVIKTFAISEDSDKTDNTGKPAYRYTPGYEIVERIREEMDKHGIMLVENCKEQESKLIDYLVYKDFHGQAMSFSKKEMFVFVAMEFTWVNVETGEKEGPYIGFGYGANGTDKSGASAMSMAKRYFLQNFFQFTTRETTDEQDAHDASNIPGLKNVPGVQSTGPVQKGPVVPAPAPFVPGAPAGTAQGPSYGTTAKPETPAGYTGGAPQQAGRQPRPYQNDPRPAPQPQQAPAGPVGEFNATDPAIQVAITALMNFEKGTPSHNKCCNEQLGRLASLGYQCMNDTFLNMLVDTAQAMREGRTH